MKRIRETLVCLMCALVLVSVTGCGNTTENGNLNDATSGGTTQEDNAGNQNGTDRDGDGILDDAVDDVTDGVDDVTDDITDGVDNAADDLTEENGPQNETQNRE